MIRMGNVCVVEQSTKGVAIEMIEDRAIIMLKVALGAREKAAKRLTLAGPLQASGGEPQSLWCGPDSWFLMSSKCSGSVLIEDCRRELDGILHNAVDYTAALIGIRLSGPGAEELLASGSGIDFRFERLPSGSCCRTQLAQLVATIVVAGKNRFEVFVESSFKRYVLAWMNDSAHIAALAAKAPQQGVLP